MYQLCIKNNLSFYKKNAPELFLFGIIFYKTKNNVFTNKPQLKSYVRAIVHCCEGCDASTGRH